MSLPPSTRKWVCLCRLHSFNLNDSGDRESVNVTVIALTQGAFHPGRATIEYSYNDGEEDVSQVWTLGFVGGRKFNSR